MPLAFSSSHVVCRLAGSTATLQERTDRLRNDYMGTPDPVRSDAIGTAATVDLLKTIYFTGYVSARGAKISVVHGHHAP